MCYPGIMSDAKSYLYRSICQPTLMYGLDAINLSAPMSMDSVFCMGQLPKYNVWSFSNISAQ